MLQKKYSRFQLSEKDKLIYGYWNVSMQAQLLLRNNLDITIQKPENSDLDIISTITVTAYELSPLYSNCAFIA